MILGKHRTKGETKDESGAEDEGLAKDKSDPSEDPLKRSGTDSKFTNVE